MSTAVFLILRADPKQRCKEESRTRAAFYLFFKFRGLGLKPGEVMAVLYQR
ncbi:hypothetical protein C4J83_3401 [Pseudomonas sp. LBUM920]|nr:hypothetical protein C4J83_3401 [Pseudomonas sp. LBUM920]